MSYSTLYIKRNKKITTLLGVVALFSFIVGSCFFINQLGRKNGWEKTLGIERIVVVNRSPSGFEVVWSTKTPAKEEQWVEVAPEKKEYSIMGKFEAIEGAYHAVVTGLQPDTEYVFRIRVGNKTYILPSILSDHIHTPKEVREKPVSPAYGKAVLPSKRPYVNGLLIYEVEGYYPIATFTKETGEWLLPLTGLIEKKSNTIQTITDINAVSIKLFAYPEGNMRTAVGQTRPLRNAIVAGTTTYLAQSIQGKGESVLGVSSEVASPQAQSISSIIYPKENALIPGSTPLIRGMAPNGKDVTVLIVAPSKQFSYRTKADEKGEWIIQSPLVLGPAKYKIVATIDNGNGLPTVLQRSFSIIKNGEQVLGTATGSPTLIPTIPVPTYANPTSAPTRAPTIGQYPTTVVPTRFVPTSTPPVTGGGMSAYLFGALFCIVVGAGLVLAF